MSSPHRAETAAGIILFHRVGGEPRYLLLRNAIHRTWGFAKGHTEAGEDELATARRETREETGIERYQLLDDFRAEIRYPVRTRNGLIEKTVIYFLAEVDQPDTRLSREHDDCTWLPGLEARLLIPHDNLRGVLDRAAGRVAVAACSREL